jgi:PAS domain S-box-containing protein
MTVPSTPLSRPALFVRYSCYFATAVPILVLAGWQFGIPILRSILPSLVSMKPLTAVAFLACSASLHFHLKNQQTPRRITELFARSLPQLPLLLGIGAILSHVLNRTLPFETFLFHSAVIAENPIHPGRMSVAAAFAFLLLSLALILYDTRTPRRAIAWQCLALGAIFFSLVQLFGYLYGAHDLYRTFGKNPMALHTALIFLALGPALFFIRPDFGWIEIFTTTQPGAIMARRIIVIAVFLPGTLGGLRLYGERQGLYQPEFGVAIFASISMTIFTIATWFAARSLNNFSRSLVGTNNELALSEERLRMAISGAGIGLWRFDLTANTVFCSPLFSELCGLSTHGLLPLDAVTSTILPEDLPTIDAALKEIRSTGHLREIEYRVLRPDGSIHWISSRGKAFYDDSGQFSRVEGIVQEITQRKLAEQQTGLITAIVESSQDAIFTKDLDGVITSWNPAAQRIYGYAPEEIIGRSIRTLAAQKREKEFDAILERVRRGESVHQLETQRQAKNGKIIDISLSVSPLRDSRGNLFGISSIARDITEQHAIEQQLRQAQKMEAVGQLAGGIAHDFNNLIMVINSYAQLIKDNSTPESPFDRYAQQIMNAGNKAATVTRQLLAFSRKQPQDLKLLDLNQLVAQFCKMLPSFIGEEIRFEVRPYSQPVHVHADAGQLEQVLMNLVVNARDAMLPKGGSVTVALDPGRYCILSVKDTAPACLPKPRRTSSNLSSPPKHRVKAPASASPPFTASSNSIAAPSASSANPIPAPNSKFFFPSLTRLLLFPIRAPLPKHPPPKATKRSFSPKTKSLFAKPSAAISSPRATSFSPRRTAKKPCASAACTLPASICSSPIWSCPACTAPNLSTKPAASSPTSAPSSCPATPTATPNPRCTPTPASSKNPSTSPPWPSTSANSSTHTNPPRTQLRGKPPSMLSEEKHSFVKSTGRLKPSP